ncbi:MAG: hypothetical protein HY811_02520 [Planctomycetes bacterium]|nr:hypothetical protein [Planctomycetota bacterium]
MIKFDDKYFSRFKFTDEQVRKNMDNAEKDLAIARKDQIPEVKFNYAYSAFIKSGIALLSYHGAKVKSVPGHHIKIIETTAELLKDETINDLGNVMRSKRNRDLYDGGIEVTGKECREYIGFAEKVIAKIKQLLLNE